MSFEKWDYSLFTPQIQSKRKGKNNILCYNENFKGRVKNAKQNRQSKRKKGLLSWKTQTKRARNLITMLH
ncbi:hypothetical protein HMPREF1411_00430 [Helicobacter pylori GAM250AFi]|nr:hypothetical protein HMPREF1411_00430 [Helicobacter pylori GAM250AFi]EMH13829.1 hypothetical protein HMPREF1412_00851 [Helicobacter pylori GAM250T]EMH45573.1 hypothetical protein HMPREF1438_01543 [Helicobacter pylori HP250AFii]EMH50529.1 hypothetical protein HMPREF1440_01324 [Helicobacter pylori HP250AFiV]